MPLTIIILAAGKGTRMKSEISKLLHPVAGRPMLSWVIEKAESLNPSQIIVVTAPGQEDVAGVAASHTIAIQHEQKGTADAVKAALPFIQNKVGDVLILLGDEPLLPVSALEQMVSASRPTVMALRTPHPKGLGRMIEGEDRTLVRIVEEKDASTAEKEINLCNAGNYCLSYDQLISWLEQIDNKNAQKEYYLTDLPEIAGKEGAAFKIVEVAVDHVWGINDRAQLAEHETAMQNELRTNAMAQGVTLIDPQTVYLSWDTKFGRDVTIEPNVFLGPDVTVGDHVTIRAFSHVEGAKIGAHSNIGPFARLRPGSELAENVKIGNFVEFKKARLSKGVKASHLGYIGDADVGAGTNFSCGAITVNYDGYDKHHTVIGENVMVGSNVNLIAPIEVGENAFIAAGSTVSNSVPQNSLALSRSATEIKEGWALTYRDRKEKQYSKSKKEGT